MSCNLPICSMILWQISKISLRKHTFSLSNFTKFFTKTFFFEISLYFSEKSINIEFVMQA